MRWGAVSLVVAVLAQTANARAAAPGPTPDPEGERAQASYQQAFVRLAQGDRAGARALLEQVARDGRGTPLAREAAARLVDLGPAPAVDGDGPSKLARGEMILFQTGHGVLVGYELCVIASCRSNRAQAISYMAGAGAGLAASYFGSAFLTEGEMHFIDSATAWGAATGLGVIDGFETDTESLSSASKARVMLTSQLAGTGAGILIAPRIAPTAGEVATGNTVGVWTVALVAMAYGMADEQPDLVTLSLVGDVAFGSGLALGRAYRVSRGRTYLIDIGGVLGAIVGALAATQVNSSGQAFTALFAGTSAGLALSTLLSSRWDAPPAPAAAQLSVVPARGGATLGIGGRF